MGGGEGGGSMLSRSPVICGAVSQPQNVKFVLCLSFFFFF